MSVMLDWVKNNKAVMGVTTGLILIGASPYIKDMISSPEELARRDSIVRCAGDKAFPIMQKRVEIINDFLRPPVHSGDSTITEKMRAAASYVAAPFTPILVIALSNDYKKAYAECEKCTP